MTVIVMKEIKNRDAAKGFDFTKASILLTFYPPQTTDIHFSEVWGLKTYW